MQKLKVSLYLTLILAIISFILLVFDFIFLNKIYSGIEGTGFEWSLVAFSGIFFLIFYISLFITIKMVFNFLKKKISRVYP